VNKKFFLKSFKSFPFKKAQNKSSFPLLFKLKPFLSSQISQRTNSFHSQRKPARIKLLGKEKRERVAPYD
jgi:hypothetical protein